MIEHKVSSIMDEYVSTLEARLKKYNEEEYSKWLDELTNIHTNYHDKIVAELRGIVKQVYKTVEGLQK